MAGGALHTTKKGSKRGQDNKPHSGKTGKANKERMRERGVIWIIFGRGVWHWEGRNESRSWSVGVPGDLLCATAPDWLLDGGGGGVALTKGQCCSTYLYVPFFIFTRAGQGKTRQAQGREICIVQATQRSSLQNYMQCSRKDPGLGISLASREAYRYGYSAIHYLIDLLAAAGKSAARRMLAWNNNIIIFLAAAYQPVPWYPQGSSDQLPPPNLGTQQGKVR